MTKEERAQFLFRLQGWALQCCAELAIRCNEMPPEVLALLDVLDRIKLSSGVRIAFGGRFSAGKTTLVNNILGNRLLLEGVTETTAIPTRLRRGEKERLLLKKSNAWYEASEPERAEFLNLNASNMSALVRNYLQEQEEVIFEHPAMEETVEVVDLPGVSSSLQKIEERALRSLIFANGIVWVVNANQGGLTRADLDYIQENVPEETPLLVTLTHMDLIPPSSRQAIVDNALMRVSNMTNIVGICGTDYHSSLNSDPRLISDWSRLIARARANPRLTPLVRRVVEILEGLKAMVMEQTADETKKAIETIGITRESFELYIAGLFERYQSALYGLNQFVDKPNHFKDMVSKYLDEQIEQINEFEKSKSGPLSEMAEQLPQEIRDRVSAIMYLWHFASSAFETQLLSAIPILAVSMEYRRNLRSFRRLFLLDIITAGIINFRFETSDELRDYLAKVFNSIWNGKTPKDKIFNPFLELYDKVLENIINAQQQRHKLFELHNDGMAICANLEDKKFLEEVGIY